MLNEEMIKLGTQKSVIRDIFEYALTRIPVVGAENVLDFSIGNPNVPAPDEVQKAILEIVEDKNPVEFHSYTSAAGSNECRDAIAENLNKRFGTDYNRNNLYITCGAAAALNIVLKAIISDEEDEIIVVAPYFPEYKPFIEAKGGKMVLVEATGDLQINMEGVKKALSEKTKGIIINTPNNPSGVIYSEETLKKLAELLKEQSEKNGAPIYLISDEPYRELVYTDEKITWVPALYDNTIVCYSWSKSLSLPGERIGYLLVPNTVKDWETFMAACGGAARILGYVNAPSLMQQVIAKCIDIEPDLEVYRKNRELLLSELTEMGYNVAKPDGAFYLFLEAPDGDSLKFMEKAKEKDLLLVPGIGFGCPTYLRLSYCADHEKVKKSIPVFRELMKEYK